MLFEHFVFAFPIFLCSCYYQKRGENHMILICWGWGLLTTARVSWGLRQSAADWWAASSPGTAQRHGSTHQPACLHILTTASFRDSLHYSILNLVIHTHIYIHIYIYTYLLNVLQPVPRNFVLSQEGKYFHEINISSDHYIQRYKSTKILITLNPRKKNVFAV